MTTIQIAPKTYHPIMRQNGQNSLQPRFQDVKPNRFFNSILRFVNEDIQNEPKYGTQERDAWLRRVWKLEPYLAGVINSVSSIDKNRGWTITGGRNQVKRFSRILHERFFFAPDLWGWRMSFGGSALSYYTSDVGSVTEIGRQGRNGPLDSLYFVDPARCWLTGNNEKPLQYKPDGGNYQTWNVDDYFRIVSMPDTDEARFGLGYCALSRCIELAKIMVGIYQYDNEMLLNRAPRGLLLLKGITQEDWEDSMTSRAARLDGDEKRYYGAVNVLASVDPGIELDAQLVALSSLPAEFDQQTFTDLLMYGYALAFGYDPREFWPVSGGSLGTATETETQHRKAGGKGGLDFVLGFAEKLNQEMPDTILFEFEERDYDGELADAEAEQAKAKVVTDLYISQPQDGLPLVNREEARIMLAERGIIDADWTLNQEESVATDEGMERALLSEQVQRAIWKFPDEPIIQYKFSIENGKEQHRWKTLVKPTRRKARSFMVKRIVKRQIEDELQLYQEQLDLISQQANDGEIAQDEYELRLEALTVAILTLAMLQGSGADNEAAQLLIDAALMILEDDSFEAIGVGLETLTNQEILQAALPQDAIDTIDEEVAGSLLSTLSNDIYAGQYEENAEGLLSRLTMWKLTAASVYVLGQIIDKATTYFIWRLGGTVEHCADCARLDGQIHTGVDWLASGYRPQGRGLACSGYNCLCTLTEIDATESVGSF